MTPQSKARAADKAIRAMRWAKAQNGRRNLLENGQAHEIADALARSGVRFHNHKAQYICEARDRFSGAGSLLCHVPKSEKEEVEKRNWLAENVKGLGYKEASHFLRNIGHGNRVAILDRHILRNMKGLRVISRIPANLGKGNYIALERKLALFSEKMRIPLSHMDFVFWSEETGEIFK
jgi:N-glycosylase/DNA lyase